MSDMDKIIALNNRLNGYWWGCVVDNEVAPDDTHYWEMYTTVTPRVFDKLKTGCCWDYCNYQADYFDRHFPNIKYSLYYIDSDEFDKQESTNHTWLGFWYGDKIYAFESSWKRFKGIHEFKSEDDMINWYVKNQFRKTSVIPPYVVYKYKRPHKDGLRPEEFMINILSDGGLVKHYLKEKE
jgi:hypothetical protein